MPVLDGFAVLEQLRERQPEILRRIVVMTAAVSEREMERVSAFAVCNVVRKPFEVETLLAAVRACADTGSSLHGMLSSGVILLLAEMLQRRWL